MRRNGLGCIEYGSFMQNAPLNKRQTKMKRIYHPYQKWEDYKHGFYNNLSGKDKDEKIKLCIEMFRSVDKTKEYMNKVINEWKYSCEHNLTNESMNKIAYIGQAACCLFADIPNGVTMEAWNMLDNVVQVRSDRLAQTVIDNWTLKQNKQNQLCLNLD